MGHAVSGKILCLEIDLGSLITLAIMFFSMLKITRGIHVFLRNCFEDNFDSCCDLLSCVILSKFDLLFCELLSQNCTSKF